MKFLIVAIFAVALAEAKVRSPFLDKLPKVERYDSRTGSVRITGGEEVTPHSIPFQVGLFIPTDEGTAFCGGSLLSPTTVVTAAHCGELSDTIEVVLGAHQIRENEATQVIVNSSRVLVHEHWDRLQLINDIALIFLPAAVELNDNINTVSVPTDDSSDYVGVAATASGWGKDSDSASSISPVLRAVTVPVAENGICNLYYLGVIQDTHICASGDGGKSTCSGDSGGPLVAETGELIGITSFGISFGCEIGWPSVYTRVTSYLDWIQQNSDVQIN